MKLAGLSTVLFFLVMQTAMGAGPVRPQAGTRFEQQEAERQYCRAHSGQGLVAAPPACTTPTNEDHKFVSWVGTDRNAVSGSIGARLKECRDYVNIIYRRRAELTTVRQAAIVELPAPPADQNAYQNYQALIAKNQQSARTLKAQLENLKKQIEQDRDPAKKAQATYQGMYARYMTPNATSTMALSGCYQGQSNHFANYVDRLKRDFDQAVALSESLLGEVRAEYTRNSNRLNALARAEAQAATLLGRMGSMKSGAPNAEGNVDNTPPGCIAEDPHSCPNATVQSARPGAGGVSAPARRPVTDKELSEGGCQDRGACPDLVRQLENTPRVAQNPPGAQAVKTALAAQGGGVEAGATAKSSASGAVQLGQDAEAQAAKAAGRANWSNQKVVGTNAVSAPTDWQQVDAATKALTGQNAVSSGNEAAYNNFVQRNLATNSTQQDDYGIKLQRAINATSYNLYGSEMAAEENPGRYPTVYQDGVVGPRTRTAVEFYYADEARRQIFLEQLRLQGISLQ